MNLPDSLRQKNHATTVAKTHEAAYASTVTPTVLWKATHAMSVNTIQLIDCPIQYAYSVCFMIFRPRLPPRYTWATATNTSAIAAAR